MPNSSSFSFIKKFLLFAFSYLSVTFGQPSGHPLFCFLTSLCAFGIFFLQILPFSAKNRFLSGFLFFFLVQAVQLFWFTFHPFLYIWGVYLLLCTLMGLQFGLLSLMVTKKLFSSPLTLLAIPACWTLMEWSRLFWFSGFYFDLVGIALTDNLLTLQMASAAGVLGLSFWVMLTNALFVHWRLIKSKAAFAILCIAFGFPYAFGLVHLTIQTDRQLQYDNKEPAFHAMIVHEKMTPGVVEAPTQSDPLEKALYQWQKILESIGPHQNEKIDLILMPEGIVMFGNRSLIFPRDQVEKLFEKNFGYVPSFSDDTLCSEEIAYEVSDRFHCPIIMGLEGSQKTSPHSRKQFFNSAFFFSAQDGITNRYDKQLLVPMGEYIPFDWAKALASQYGIFDSFDRGMGPRIFESGRHKIGSSICYEETFGNLMRQNSLLGATMLVNLTDDYWFPYSKLDIQHFDHARPRTVENGIPLLRACNFGISGAVDSLGRIVKALKAPEQPNAFIVSFSSYHYKTLYSQIGDLPLIAFSLVVTTVIAFFLWERRREIFP